MNKAEANEEARILFEVWCRRKDEIIKKAKENGTWQMGLDSNNGLFKELDEEIKGRLKVLASMIEE